MFLKTVLIFITLCFIIVQVHAQLWDEKVGMEAIETLVPYDGRYLKVWRQKRENSSDLYFVTPLGIFLHDSIRCSEKPKTRDKGVEYRDYHYKLYFNVRVWDESVAEIVRLSLKSKGMNVSASDIFPLPMKNIRLYSRSDEFHSEMQYAHWKTNHLQPKIVKFFVYVRDKNSCEEKKANATHDPEQFLDKTELEMEFMISTGKQESRDITIRGKSLTESSFYTNLLNNYMKNGEVFLTSEDLSNLAQNIIQETVIRDIVTSGYIEPDQENALLMKLIGDLRANAQQIISTELSKDQWASVFWKDIFSRPDVQTEYFNKSFTHDEGTKHFIYNSDKEKLFKSDFYTKHDNLRTDNDEWSFGFNLFEKFDKKDENKESPKSSDKNQKNDKEENKNSEPQNERLRLNFGATESSTNHDITENKGSTHDENKHNLTLDQLNKFMKEKKINVKWTGEKFEQKPMNLFRINLRSLQAKESISYRRTIVSTSVKTESIHLWKQHSNYSALEAQPSWTNILEKIEGTLKTLDNKIDSSVIALDRTLKTLDSKIDSSVIALEGRINANYLSKSLYEQSLGLLPHEKNYVYNAIHRHRLCRALTSLHPNFDWDTVWPTWNSLACAEYYEPQRVGEMKYKGEWILVRLKTGIAAKILRLSLGMVVTLGGHTMLTRIHVLHNLNWDAAENQCKSYNAHLSSIHSDDENNFIISLTKSGAIELTRIENAVWIGLYAVRLSGKSTTYAWTDETAVDYTKWGIGEPDNFGQYGVNVVANCVDIYPDLVKGFEGFYSIWDDNVCGVNMRSSVCKKPAILYY